METTTFMTTSRSRRVDGDHDFYDDIAVEEGRWRPRLL